MATQTEILGLDRTRALLRYTACRLPAVTGCNGTGMQAWGYLLNRPGRMKVQGHLTFEEMRAAVRGDLRISQRAIGDEALEEVHECIRMERGRTPSPSSLLAFVQRSRPQKDVSDKAMTRVKRGFRLAMARAGVKKPDGLRQMINEVDRSGDGELSVLEFKKFLRGFLKITKHECTDEEVAVVHKALDEDGSGFISVDEVVELGREEAAENAPRPPALPPSLKAKLRKPLIDAEPEKPSLAFVVNGRELPSRSRLAMAGTSFLEASGNSRNKGATQAPPSLHRSNSMTMRDAASESAYSRAQQAKATLDRVESRLAQAGLDRVVLSDVRKKLLTDKMHY